MDNKKHLDAPGCTKERFSPGCSGCNSVVVVAREGKTNDENKRFNATITVYSLDGTKTDFVGSTLPDNIYGTYDDGRGHAKVKPGIYSIEIGEDHCKSRAYNVKTTTGGWFVPCQRWDGNNWYDDTADGILIHRAEDGPTSKPWSTGCITIEGYLEYDSYGIPHDPTMEKFAELVGSSAILIIER